MNCRSSTLFLAGLLALRLAAFAADDKKDGKKEPAKHAGLERLKQLAGVWVGKDEDGQFEGEIKVVYKVTAAGSAVVETLFPGSSARTSTSSKSSIWSVATITRSWKSPTPGSSSFRGWLSASGSTRGSCRRP